LAIACAPGAERTDRRRWRPGPSMSIVTAVTQDERRNAQFAQRPHYQMDESRVCSGGVSAPPQPTRAQVVRGQKSSFRERAVMVSAYSSRSDKSRASVRDGHAGRLLLPSHGSRAVGDRPLRGRRIVPISEPDAAPNYRRLCTIGPRTVTPYQGEQVVTSYRQRDRLHIPLCRYPPRIKHSRLRPRVVYSRRRSSAFRGGHDTVPCTL